MYIQHSFQTT